MSDTFTIGSATDTVTDINLAPQCRTILAHLKKGETITNAESMLVYHISRLSDVVRKLRLAGYDISTTMKKDGVGGKYASYKLVS
jgi:hypothetical protein